jgi:hypothetical protein
MSRRDGGHRVSLMSPSHREPGQRPVAVSTIVWNTIVPMLGLALILGASLLPAVVIAGVAAIAIAAVLGGGLRLPLLPARVVAQRVGH